MRRSRSGGSAGIEKRFVYVYLDGVWLKRSWGGRSPQRERAGGDWRGRGRLPPRAGRERRHERRRCEWTAFLRELKQRGLEGVQLFVSDKCLGLIENLAEFYPEARWQRCVVHAL